MEKPVVAAAYRGIDGQHTETKEPTPITPQSSRSRTVSTVNLIPMSPLFDDPL
jgi:hypothetical protein